MSDHLYSFRRYAGEGSQVYYVNAFLGLPAWLAWVRFDLVVLHYTFMAEKWQRARWQRQLERTLPVLSRLQAGHLAVMCQDEYVHSDPVNDFLRELGVGTMVTCLPEHEWETVYPRARSGLSHYLTQAPGYVDELACEWVARQPTTRAPRPIDIGYRARRLPYWLGRHAQLKWEIADRIQRAEGARGLTLDLSTDPGDVFLGDDWYRFLLRSRVMPGCEGGASLHDPDGSIRARVDEYVAAHPAADFDEVEAACFPGLDGNLELFAISPRHFECAMTRTTQLLVEGDYNGIMRADEHYIPVAKDWSNLDEALARAADPDHCRELAERAHEDLVASGRYTYRVSVRSLLDHVERVAPPSAGRATRRERALLRALRLLERLDPRLRRPRRSYEVLRSELVSEGRLDTYALAAWLHGRVQRLRGRGPE